MHLIYDCEIYRMIPSRDGVYLDGLEYCSGWEDFSNMGISTIAVVDLHSDFSQVFNLNFRSSSEGFSFDSLVHTNQSFLGFFDVVDEFQKLILTSGVTYGFNSCKFDDQLCKAHGILVKTDYDLLEHVRLAAYGSINWYDSPRGYTYKLEALAQANGLGGKSGSGELAPQLWQRGEHQQVIDYCLRDVQLTKQLILKFLANELIDPNTGLVLHPVYIDAQSKNIVVNSEDFHTSIPF